MNWGILGTGAIAHKFAEGLTAKDGKGSRTGKLIAVGSRSQETADTFADQFNIPNRHADYDSFLADPEIDAVYISTPHPLHAEWTIRAADAGKHVLCEKPIALNATDTARMIEAAQRNGVQLMEAFMYRCHPQSAKLADLLRENVIGKVHMIVASFGFNGGFSTEGRLFRRDLGGGGILDVGCYAVSMSRLIAGASQGGDFADPTEVKGLGHLNEAGTDGWTAAVLKFPGDIVAQVSTSIQCTLANTVSIYGSEGYIEVPSPWFCAPGDDSANILVYRDGADVEEITTRDDRQLYAIEADTFAQGVEQGRMPYPAMSLNDSLGNMATLDKWRAEIGLKYDGE
jgi:predicted dehydrogenase